MGQIGDATDFVHFLTLGARGFAAIAVMTTLVGGIPRVAQVALAIGCGMWTSVVMATRLTTVNLPQHALFGSVADPGGAGGIALSWQLAMAELAIGAVLGVVAAVPLLAARTAGRMTDISAAGRGGGPYEALFGLLAGVVFLGTDGHTATMTAIVESHHTMPFLALTRGHLVAGLARLMPAAIRLAIPWLVTAAVVQVAIGVGTRLAGRASAHMPSSPAMPAALVMMTATLVGTFSMAVVAIVRGTL